MIDFSKYKTIRQIADEIGVSTQAIHKKINKSMQIELNPHIKIVNRQKLIDEQGVKIIKNGCQPTTIQENELSTILENTNETPNFTEKTGCQPSETGLQPTENNKACVYRFLNNADEILYIGLTKNLHKRVNLEHFSGAGHLPDECYLETQKVEYINIKDNENAEEKEDYYITKYVPKYNSITKYTDSSINYDDKWINFDFYKNTEGFLKKYTRAIKLTEENNQLKTDIIFYKNQYQILQENISVLQKQIEEPDEMTINYINSLKEQISILTADKEYGRAQIADLHDELKKQSERIADLADKLVELTRNSQVLLKQEQDKTAFLLPEQQTKRPFWQFWKK